MRKTIIINGTPAKISPVTAKKIEKIAAEQKTSVSAAIKLCFQKVK